MWSFAFEILFDSFFFPFSGLNLSASNALETFHRLNHDLKFLFRFKKPGISLTIEQLSLRCQVARPLFPLFFSTFSHEPFPFLNFIYFLVTSIGFQHDWDKIIDEFFGIQIAFSFVLLFFKNLKLELHYSFSILILYSSPPPLLDYTPLGTLVRKSILQTRKFGLRSKFLFHFFDGLSTLVQTEVTLDSFLDFEISRVSKTVDELSFDSPLPSTSFQMLLLCNTSPFHNSYPQFLGFCEILQSELDIILQINLSRQQPSLPPRTKMDLSSRICGRSSFVYESHSLSCGVYFSSVNHEDDILFFNRLPEDPFYRFRAYIQSIDPNKTWSKIVLESKLKFGPSLKEYLLSKSVMLVFQIHQLSNPSRNPQQTLSYLSSEPAPSKKILNCCVFNAMQKLLEASLSHSDSCPEAQSLEFGCFSDELNSPNEIKVRNFFSFRKSVQFSFFFFSFFF